MLREDLQKRIKEIQNAIDQSAANLNALIGRRDELNYILSEMDKFKAECDKTECDGDKEINLTDEQRTDVDSPEMNPDLR